MCAADTDQCAASVRSKANSVLPREFPIGYVSSAELSTLRLLSNLCRCRCQQTIHSERKSNDLDSARRLGELKSESDESPSNRICV